MRSPNSKWKHARGGVCISTSAQYPVLVHPGVQAEGYDKAERASSLMKTRINAGGNAPWLPSSLL